MHVLFFIVTLWFHFVHKPEQRVLLKVCGSEYCK